MLGGVFFNFNDLVNSEEQLKDKNIFECLESTLRGEAIDAGLWQWREGFWREAGSAVRNGGDTSFVSERLERDAKFVALAASVQCLVRRN